MGRATSAADRAALSVLRKQSDLITRSQALNVGLTPQTLRSKLGANGPWRAVLPGIYLAHKGGLTAAQQQTAAVLYAGGRCVVTGVGALAEHGMRVDPPNRVDVLIPASATRRSTDFVRIQRTTRMPSQVWEAGGIRYAPAARAVADAVRGQTEKDFGRALVAGAVQQRICTVPQLAAELRDGPTQGSAPLRAALAEVADGIASIAEGDLRNLIRKGKLPTPLYNPRLYLGEEFLGSPDAWWPDAGVAGEVDSRQWHLSPDDWERTQQRHTRMGKIGIVVQHFSPRRIRSEPAKVLDDLRRAIESGLQRPPPPVRTIPAR
jgi:hypothetical protein